MSDGLQYFDSGGVVSAVHLPFDLSLRLEQWQMVRKAMLRGPAPGFTRDEWAYLVGFLDRSVLTLPFQRSFGSPCGPQETPRSLFRARGGLAIWLPNNASLLGPLVLVMASIAGVAVRAKSGSRAQDLAGEFVAFCLRVLSDCELRRYFESDVAIERFDRQDHRNASMSLWAASRMVFGSDEAASAISALPHRPGCRTFAFGDHRSEAWIEPGLVDDEAVVLLGRVFMIYGRAGCTSPNRVVLIDGSVEDARRLCERLLSLWPRISAQRPGANVASECVMALQLARAAGVRGGAWLAPENGALLVADEVAGAALPGTNVLPIVCGTVDDAIARMPENIQTVGYLLDRSRVAGLYGRIAPTPVKRLVPLRAMHHFGPVWDGYSYWRELFEEVEIA